VRVADTRLLYSPRPVPVRPLDHKRKRQHFGSGQIKETKAPDVECQRKTLPHSNHDGGASCGGVYPSRDG
jgi:hypothetical protein